MALRRVARINDSTNICDLTKGSVIKPAAWDEVLYAADANSLSSVEPRSFDLAA